MWPYVIITRIIYNVTLILHLLLDFVVTQYYIGKRLLVFYEPYKIYCFTEIE